VNKAEEDYWAAHYLYEKSKEKLATVICFHAQQSAEKYLKALLTKTQHRTTQNTFFRSAAGHIGI
jgi:HEPN domain-containing protein